MVNRVRWFEAGDVDGVVGIHSQCAGCFEELGVDRDFILSASERRDFRLAVAEDGGKIVGFAGVLFFENVGRAELGPIAVSPGFRGMGVGSGLVGFLFGFLRGMGVRRVVAVVKCFNRDALSFFLGKGFVFEAYLRKFTLKDEDAVQLVFFLD